jgi:Glycosyl transferase family 2
MPPQAPIAIFIYNRPDHLRSTIGWLSQCDGFADSSVIVFGDGPKRADQVAQVEAARDVAREMLGAGADYRFSPVNKGLARSIIDGVNALVAEHGCVIVVEDDLQLAPGFLVFMNAALERYRDDETVYQVSGYAFDVPELAESRHAVMLPSTSTWGWATWQRAWVHLDEAAAGWERLLDDPAMRNRFNLGGVCDYTTMLRRQMLGRSDSWGVKWYWTVFRRDGLAVFPPQTLVRNAGMDGSGSHGRGVLRTFSRTQSEFPTGAFELPPPVIDVETNQAVRRTIWRQNGGWLGQFMDALKKVSFDLKKRR